MVWLPNDKLGKKQVGKQMFVAALKQKHIHYRIFWCDALFDKKLIEFVHLHHMLQNTIIVIYELLLYTGTSY